jgi:N-acetylglucosaminyl-diphospho-decaprenol L-rhamnosyltransferase
MGAAFFDGDLCGVAPVIAKARVAIVVVNYRTPGLAVHCVRSLRGEREALPDLKVVVVDGGSGDGSAEQLQRDLGEPEFSDWVEVLPLAINGGFGWANNQAILKLMSGAEQPEFIHLLNPDTEVEPGAVQALLQVLLNKPRAGAVGSQLLEPDGSTTGSAFVFPSLRGEFARGARTGFLDRLLRVPPPAIDPAPQPVEAEWVTGASTMFRVETLRQTGLFDDGFFLYHEEVELMWRMRQAGWEIWHEPASRVKHVGGAATGVHSRAVEESRAPRRPAYWYESRARFFARSRGLLAARAAWLMWLAGHAIYRARLLAGVQGSGKPVTRELRDAVKHGLPRPHQKKSGGAAALDAPQGVPPAWMQHR